MTKPFAIPKALVWEAFQRVKANGGSAGVDDESIEKFEACLGDNLYKLWNRMQSGSYFPQPLELHPEKTRIVYCHDVNRQDAYPTIQFTFLGYTFRPRKAVDKYRLVYVNFSPAVSREALRTMRHTVRGWHLQLKSDKELSDLSNVFGPVLRGWANYYGRFYPTALKPLWRQMNDYLVRWLQRKHKHLARGVTRAARALRRLADSAPRSFVHWERGFFPAAR